MQSKSEANRKLRAVGLSGIDELDNQRCPKCNEIYDFETRPAKNAEGYSYNYRVFERHKHICKKNK